MRRRGRRHARRPPGEALELGDIVRAEHRDLVAVPAQQLPQPFLVAEQLRRWMRMRASSAFTGRAGRGRLVPGRLCRPAGQQPVTARWPRRLDRPACTLAARDQRRPTWATTKDVTARNRAPARARTWDRAWPTSLARTGTTRRAPGPTGPRPRTSGRRSLPKARSPAMHDGAAPRARRVVVVTGASAGIGRATAIEFARHGWRVALLARGQDGLEGARADVEHAGGEALVIPTDVADQAQVEASAERVEREWGPIDAWVNNAMATIFAEFLDVDPDDYRRATEVTYLGTVWGTRAALRRMRPRDRGTIVQVGSALAYRSPLQAPYCGAKAAIRGFTDSLRSELIH